MQDDKEQLIRKIENILADWDLDGGETYRELALRFLEEMSKIGATDLPEKG